MSEEDLKGINDTLAKFEVKGERYREHGESVLVRRLVDLEVTRLMPDEIRSARAGLHDFCTSCTPATSLSSRTCNVNMIHCASVVLLMRSLPSYACVTPPSLVRQARDISWRARDKSSRFRLYCCSDMLICT